MKLSFLINFIFISFFLNAQQKKIQFGAYYFDGWNGSTNWLLTKSLTDTFTNREPRWGWLANTQAIIDTQISIAKAAGLSFFEFCWYYPDNWHKTFSDHPLNNALKLFLNSKNKSGLKFSLLIANHDGFYISANDWPTVTNAWINLFKDKRYMTIDNKPMITFFNVRELINKFGSAAAVKNAFNAFKETAINKGLSGVCILGCVDTSKNLIKDAEDCGFDVLTGYNYHEAGFKTNGFNADIIELQNGEKNTWTSIINTTFLKYLPSITLNWDPRPWYGNNNWYKNSGFYTGFSAKSVSNSVINCKNWMLKNIAHITGNPVALIYAWNEYGEGAWLTPSKTGENMLEGLNNGLKTTQ